MRTIGFLNWKGGVGKTSIAINTAYALAESWGVRVLFIDMDKQGNASYWFDCDESRGTLSNLLVSCTNAEEVYDLAPMTAEEIIQPTRYPNIDLIAGDPQLLEINLALLKNAHGRQDNILSEALAPIRDRYDVCIIDNPPDSNIPVLNGLRLMDDVVAVTLPNRFSLNGVEHLEQEIKNLGLAIGIRGVIVNQFAKLRFVERDENIEPDPERRIELREYTGKYSYREIFFASSREEALRQYKEMDHTRTGRDSNRETKNPFGIYRWKGQEEYFIGRKLGKTWLEVAKPFATPDEARDYMATHLDNLRAKYEEMKQVPFERESENAPRTGTPRHEEDVSPELFAETFGFRGVEFGNWVENGKRQDNLNQAYDALMDLSAALNLPPKALSLSGSLSLAFGARGRGGRQAPSAHYEPVKVVINLTKQSGAGSLAHEWLHAVDNYFARRDGGSPVAMMTKGTRYAGDVREEVAASAFAGQQNRSRASGEISRCPLDGQAVPGFLGTHHGEPVQSAGQQESAYVRLQGLPHPCR